jgi:glycosidase
LIEQGSIQQNTIDTHVWLKKNFYPAVKAAKPEAFTIGELFGDDLDTILGYTKGRQFDSAFHFQLAEAILKSVNTSNGMYVSSMLKISEKKLPDDQYAPFLANHDQNRAMSQLYGDMNKARLAAFLMLTSPGTPFIYYGEEIGMKGQKPDEDIRLPMQWNPQKNAGFTTNKPWRAPAKDYEFINVELQTGIPGSLLEHYRAVIQLRNAHPALSIGALTVLETNHSSIYAVLRADMDETLLVLVNLKDEPVTRYGIVMDKSPFKGIIEGVETLFGVGDAKVPQKSGDYKPFESLAPYAMYILKIKY